MDSSTDDSQQNSSNGVIEVGIPPNLLLNPHQHVKVPPKNKFAIVKGNYAYYHYGQDGLEDSGWGCAYRSFQTVSSWLKLQGHIDKAKPVPTHTDIQKCLVDIGDKPAKFVGSQQWIGSLELSYCLENLFAITSRILSSNSGANLAEHARALLYHFENGGAPVMIGGGQLAHTILGVDYNVRSGDCQYLILDPHYFGPESIDAIVDKGWCGWKPASFWNKKSFYNLLLPINPDPVATIEESDQNPT